MQAVATYRDLMIPILKKYAIKRASIFGSIAKGHATADSDLDLLVEAEPGFTLFKMLQLEEDIASVLSLKVDVVEFNAIKASIKSEVLQTAIPIL